MQDDRKGDVLRSTLPLSRWRVCGRRLAISQVRGDVGRTLARGSAVVAITADVVDAHVSYFESKAKARRIKVKVSCMRLCAWP